MEKNLMTEYENILKIKAMNRKDRRNFAKKLGISYAQLMDAINFEIVDMTIDQIPEGTKVKINYDRIMKHKDELSDKYIEWITEHKDEIFTCEKDESLSDTDTRVQLAEDTNEVKWLFHTSDLILVDENGNAVGYALD
jgi:hypothetical protein